MPIHIDRGFSQEELQCPIKYYRSSVDTAFHINTTIEELLQILRKKKIKHEVYYFYAIDDNNRLYGMLPIKEILVNPLDTRLIEIVDEDVVTLYEGVSVEHALKVLTDYQYLSVPIVDDEYRLVGLFEIVPPDINFSRRFKKRPSKEIQDVFQIVGFTIERSKLDSKWTEYCYRMPWLMGNLFAGFMCAAIASHYQATLTKAVILSLFIPLVLTLAESISMQSMTISLQFLHYRKTPWKEVFKRVIHEWSVSFFLGITSALLLSIYYILGYDQDWYPDLSMIAIAFSIFISMSIAASFGTLFPLILHNLALDPKIASGPVVLMITDMMTTAIYLGLATWILL